MKLIDLLVKELPKMGGWPESANESIEMHMDGDIFFDGDLAPESFSLPRCSDGWEPGIGMYSNEVTRAQYEAALAKNDGWIEWGGGECPVHESANVDIKLEDGSEKSDVPAYAFIWQHDDDVTNIIAYRLHKPEINSRAKDDRLEQDLNECIGQDVDMPEWNGDGLPPVGTVCMANLGNGWTDVKVAYIGDEGGFREALVFEIKSTKPAWADEFRPLRTEADKARDGAIKEMILYTSLDANSAKDCNHIANIYDAISAGKIPGVKLEGK